MKSGFGQGLTYCLGLFLCHSERAPLFSPKIAKIMKYDEETADKRNAELWFNGASDHFYDLEIPEKLPKSLKQRLRKLQNKSLHWGHGFKQDVTGKDQIWAIQEAKDLLRLIDKFMDVKTQKGSWE